MINIFCHRVADSHARNPVHAAVHVLQHKAVLFWVLLDEGIFQLDLVIDVLFHIFKNHL